MEVFVKKTKLDESTSGREPGLKCLLYEARNNPQVRHVEQQNLKEALNKIGPNMALSQLTDATNNPIMRNTKFGKSEQGSYCSY